MPNDKFLPGWVRRPPGRRAALARLLALPVMACGTAKPGHAAVGEPVVLTVSGPLLPGSVVDFSMAALAALPQVEIVSSTPWYSRARRFTGPLLREILAVAGAPATAERLRLQALNDYRIEIPMADVRRYEVIVARLLDGQPMAVRDKGPLFVMYPFDAHTELHGAVHYSRAIWQLRSLEVL